jgi:hypothetical protein
MNSIFSPLVFFSFFTGSSIIINKPALVKSKLDKCRLDNQNALGKISGTMMLISNFDPHPIDNRPAGQNHSNFALNTGLSAPLYDTWCKICSTFTAKSAFLGIHCLAFRALH